MSVLSFIRTNKMLSLWGVFLIVTTWTQLLLVNNYINPDSGRLFNMAQLQLQFAFTPENGVEVLRSWGVGGAERYLQVIWIDVAFALSYGPFFYMLIRKLNGGFFWSIISLLEMSTNFIETGIEIYWVINHAPNNMMAGAFLFHSVMASIKWFILVPTYLIHSTFLVLSTWMSRNAKGLTLNAN